MFLNYHQFPTLIGTLLQPVADRFSILRVITVHLRKHYAMDMVAGPGFATSNWLHEDSMGLRIRVVVELRDQSAMF